MDVSNIPKCYGGDLDWQWGDMPNLDDDARGVISGVESSATSDKESEGRAESGYLKGPMVFNTEKNRVDVLGKIKDQPRRMEIPVSLEKSEQSDTTASSIGPAATPATATTAATTPAATTPDEKPSQAEDTAQEQGQEQTA